MRLAIALAALAVPSLAHADDVVTDLVPTAVQARLVGTTVELSASYEFDVEGPLVANVETLALPSSGVITGAVVRINNASHRLQLLPSDDVAKQVGLLSEQSGADAARTWAVQITSSGVSIAAPTSAHVALDVDISVATEFASDQRWIDVPCAWPPLAGVGRPSGSCEESQRITFDVPRIKDVTVTGESAALPHDDVARVEVDLPKQLSRIPGDLHTLIVVDRSRSMSEAEQDTARSVIASYLKQVPGSRVQAIGYARSPRTLLRGWTAARGAATKIERALKAQPLRNGSDLARALDLAGSQLAAVSGTRRVLLLTDERISYEMQDKLSTLASKYLPRNTLVHVVDIAGWEQGFVRYDDATLSGLASETGGITVAARDDGQGLDALLLARPITLDHIRITNGTLSGTLEDETSCSAKQTTGLAEGQSCSWVGTGLADGGAEVTLTAMLWGTEISRTLVPDPTHARELARRLSVHPYLSNTVPLRDDVEEAAQAVNNAWSLLATWGTGGYQDVVEGEQGWSTMGLGCQSFTSSQCGGFSPHGSNDYETELREQLQDAVAQCRPVGPIEVFVETTLQEIVEVGVTTSDPLDEWAETCISERVWNTAIELSYADPHRTAKLRFQP